MITVTDPATGSSIAMPETWSLVPGSSAGVGFMYVNPGYGPGDIVEHEIVLYQLPIPTAELLLDLDERIRRGGAQVDRLFGGFVRRGQRILAAPHGPIARLDYVAAHAQGFAAATQRASSMLLATVVSLPAVAGRLDDQVLAMLDSAVVVAPDPALAARDLVGQWVVPGKGGTSLELLTFNPDGTYVYHFESSHTGSIRNMYGDTTASWGTAAQDDDAGRWQIQGDALVLAGRRGVQTHLFRLWLDGGKRHLQVGSATYVR